MKTPERKHTLCCLGIFVPLYIMMGFCFLAILQYDFNSFKLFPPTKPRPIVITETGNEVIDLLERDMHGRFNDFEGKITNVQANINSFQVKSNDRVEQLKAEVDLKASKEEASAIGEEIEVLKQGRKTAEEKHGKLSMELANLTRHVKERFNNTDERFSEIEEEVGRQDEMQTLLKNNQQIQQNEMGRREDLLRKLEDDMNTSTQSPDNPGSYDQTAMDVAQWVIIGILFILVFGLFCCVCSGKSRSVKY